MTTYIQPSQAASEIITKIRDLVNIPDEDLESEMKNLKKALLENPDAVALMLPEDIGATVAALRRVTGESIEKATKEKAAGTRSKKSKALTAEEMNAAFEEL